MPSGYLKNAEGRVSEKVSGGVDTQIASSGKKEKCTHSFPLTLSNFFWASVQGFPRWIVVAQAYLAETLPQALPQALTEKLKGSLGEHRQ
jgi:hypothetical protein